MYTYTKFIGVFLIMYLYISIHHQCCGGGGGIFFLSWLHL